MKGERSHLAFNAVLIEKKTHHPDKMNNLLIKHNDHEPIYHRAYSLKLLKAITGKTKEGNR